MKNSLKVISSLLFAASVRTLSAQAANPPESDPQKNKEANVTPIDSNASTGDEVLKLTPFQVTTDKDVGYQANDTLAGSRIRTNLNDVGSAIQVATKEFLRDIGATDNQSLLTYMTGAEVGGSRGNFAGLGDNTVLNDNNQRGNPNGTTRLRGLDSADNTRDYYLTDIAWDGYNTSRIDIQRGSNSILFGNGSPAGIINGTTDAALIGRNEAEVTARFGSYGSFRASFSGNVSVANQFAVRVAGLDDQEYYRQDPSFDRNQRKYVAATWDMKFLNKFGIHSTLHANFEQGNDRGNRPRESTPIDEITPWFLTTPRQMVTPNGVVLGTISPMISHAGYNPFDVDILNSTGLAAANPSQRDIGAHQTGNANTEPWLWAGTGNGVNALWYTGFAAIYPNANSGASSGYLAAGVPNLSGISPSSGLRTPSLINIVNFANYAIANNFLYNAQGIYRATTLSDPSIFNFYDTLIDGPNSAQWNTFHTFNASWDATFWHDRIGFQLAFDHQNYIQGQYSALGGSPVISLDIWSYLPRATTDASGNLQPVANPNFGRAFTIGNASGSQIQHIRTTARFTPYVQLDASDLAHSTAWWTKVVGKHSISGLVERNVYDNLGWNWAGTSLTDAQSLALFNANQNVTSTTRQVSVLSYLGGSLIGRTSASGANIPGITSLQSPVSGSSYYFNPTYLSAAPVGSTAWTAGGTVGILPNQNGAAVANQLQINNPANYVGWNSTSPLLVWNGDTGPDRNNLYTSVTNRRTVTSSSAAVDQWSLLDNSIVATVGVRKDEVKSYLAGGTGSLPLLSNGTVNLNAPFGYPGTPNSTFTSDLEKTYDVVFHLPSFIEKHFPAGTHLSFFYNQSDNFRPESRVDIFNNPLAPPTGKTKDRGFIVTALDGRVSIKMNWYISQVHQTTLADNGLLNFIGDEVAHGIEFSYDAMNHVTNDGGYNFVDPASGFVSAFQPTQTNPTTADYQAADAQAQKAAQAILADAATNPVTKAFMAAYRIDPTKWSVNSPTAVAQTIPAGAAITGDTISKGTELEITLRPVDGWNIAINGSRQFATRTGLAGDITSWIVSRYAFLQGPAGDLRWFGGGTGSVSGTGALRFGRNAFKWYNQFHALEGTNVPELRPYGLNVVNNYTFRHGELKGLTVGAGWRWQDKNIIGYGVQELVPAAGASNPAQGSFNTALPYYGPIEQHVDLNLAYERKFKKVDYRVQLNVFNVLDHIGLVPITANPDGSIAAYRIQSGPTWELTNTIKF